MRARELLGIHEARVRCSPTADDSGKKVARLNGKPITLKLLHNLRVQRDRRDAELAVQQEFVKLMYGPGGRGDEEGRKVRHGPKVKPPSHARQPKVNKPSKDVVQNDTAA